MKGLDENNPGGQTDGLQHSVTSLSTQSLSFIQRIRSLLLQHCGVALSNGLWTYNAACTAAAAAAQVRVVGWISENTITVGQVSSVMENDRCHSRTQSPIDICHAWYTSQSSLHKPHDSPFILVFCVERSSRNSGGAAKQRWGLKISQFSTNNSIYLRNG